MTASRPIRALVVLLGAAGVLLLGGARAGLADPSLPNIPPHRHYVVTATGERTEVGPRVCDDPALQGAFNQFHANIHVHVPGSTGPAQSAPGLHDHQGTEITFGPC